MPCLRPSVSWLLLPLALAACAEEPASKDDCAAVVITAVRADDDHLVVGDVSGAKAGRTRRFALVLSSAGGWQPGPGAYDLASAEDSNPLTCKRCVSIVETSPDGTPITYVARKGKLDLTSVPKPLEGEIEGELSDVELVPMDFGPANLKGKVVPGLQCLRIAELTLDTTVAPDKACQSAEDCGESGNFACDPATGRCTSEEDCDGNADCDKGEVCIAQGDDEEVSACYPACAPFAPVTGCPADHACVPAGDQVGGYCLKRGTAAAGAACTSTDLATGCVDGYWCDDLGPTPTCAKVCDFLSDTPGCPDGQLCTLYGTCQPATQPNQATVAIDSACAAGALFCAATSGRLNGICSLPDREDKTCTALCIQGHAQRGCSAGTCKDAFDLGTTAGTPGACL